MRGLRNYRCLHTLREFSGLENFDWRHLPAGFCGKCLQFRVEGFRDSRIQASPGLYVKV